MTRKRSQEEEEEEEEEDRACVRTFSYSRPLASRAIQTRCANGQATCVYSVIFGAIVAPLIKRRAESMQRVPRAGRGTSPTDCYENTASGGGS